MSGRCIVGISVSVRLVSGKDEGFEDILSGKVTVLQRASLGGLRAEASLAATDCSNKGLVVSCNLSRSRLGITNGDGASGRGKPKVAASNGGIIFSTEDG